jgi:hypothetical protein
MEGIAARFRLHSNHSLYPSHYLIREERKERREKREETLLPVGGYVHTRGRVSGYPWAGI